MTESRLPADVIERLSRSGDCEVGRTLAVLVETTARLGVSTDAPQSPLRGLLAVDEVAAGIAAGLVVGLREDHAFVERLSRWLEVPEGELGEWVASFQEGVFRKALAHTDAVVKQVAAMQRAGVKPAAVPKKDGVKEGRAEDAPQPPPSVEPTGDDPRDVPPHQVWGETVAGDHYAVSLHCVACVEPTTPAFIDDEIVWVVKGYQQFVDFPTPIQVEFTSEEHADVSAGDVLSRISEHREPSAEEGTKVMTREDRIAPRMWRRMAGKAGVTYDEYFTGTFLLEKFDHCFIELKLLESEAAQRELVSQIFQLIAQLAGAGVVSAGTFSGIGLPLGPATGGIDPSFRRVGELLAELFRGEDATIGRTEFTVRRGMIEAAFQAGPVHTSPKGFDYVSGPGDDLTGKGSYRVVVRYERYRSG